MAEEGEELRARCLSRVDTNGSDASEDKRTGRWLQVPQSLRENVTSQRASATCRTASTAGRGQKQYCRAAIEEMKKRLERFELRYLGFTIEQTPEVNTYLIGFRLKPM